MTTKKHTSGIKISKRTITKTIEAKVFEVPLEDILRKGMVSYSDYDIDPPIDVSVGEECQDTFGGLLVNGKVVDPKDVVVIFAEEIEEDEYL